MWFPIVCILFVGVQAMAAENILRVDTATAFRETSPRLWGIFFEEINHSGDGGLYAEMVRNRSFEDNRVPEGCVAEGDYFVSPTGWRLRQGDQAIPKLAWSLVAERADAVFELDRMRPLNDASPTYARLEVRALVEGGRAGIANEGFWGMSVVADAVYDLSLYARAVGGYNGGMVAALESEDGARTYATASLAAPGADWTRIEATLTSNDTDRAARLALYATAAGVIELDMVSLFPRETYKGRPNGLRPDLAEMAAALKPAFIRFPGGCIVEGFTPQSAWHWKETVGDIAARPGRQNLWGYRATDGFGYHEMLQFAEDIGAEPILVVNCGITCQGRRPIFQAMDDLDRYVQDALDAIEYANGDADTPWGAERARNGRAEPFTMKYITIGNENWGPEYAVRYRVIAEAIRARYPDILLISNDRMPDAPVDLEEHHFYMTPAWFAANANMYDEYDRALPKVFVSEYAANQECGKGNLEAAIGEAAFMIGMENNSDIVDMAAYAPLFNNEHNREWPVNLIVFDNHRAYGIPSYYVQQLFAENLPDVLLATTYPAHSETLSFDTGRIGLGSWKTRVEYKDIIVTQADETLYTWNPREGLDGWDVYDGVWQKQDGMIRQTDLGEKRLVQVGDPAWRDYTLRVKARKIDGEEGFLILVRSRDNANWLWVNLGGWNNTQHAITSALHNSTFSNFAHKPGSIEAGRWYAIEVTVEGERIRVLLDDELLYDEEIKVAVQQGIVANAGRVRETGEYIIKATNFLDRPVELQVALDGAIGALTGTVTTLYAADRAAENSLDEPSAVVPAVAPLHTETAVFPHLFPPCSLTVIRVAPEAAPDSPQE